MDSLLSSSSPTFTSSSSSSQPNHAWVWVSFIKKVADLTTHKRVSNENEQQFCYLQNGMALLAVTENAAHFLATLASNPTFLSAIFALFVAQSTKVFLNFLKEEQWDFRLMLTSEGMPSSYSTLCCALTTSVALSHGVADPLFPVSLGFSLIVMYDAINLRKHAGYQAQIVNAIVEAGFFEELPFFDDKLEEDLGNTLPQVLAGALLGSSVAILCCLGFMLLR